MAAMLRSPVSLFRLLASFALGSMLFPAPASAETWREIQSPHFRVLTQGSEREGRDVAKEFGQMRHVFELRFDHPTLEPARPC